jgi:alpha-1,3-glucan synthase
MRHGGRTDIRYAPRKTQLTKPLDLTLIDPHLGTIDDFREAITEIHRRGMYILLDNTVSTYFPALH